MLLILVFVLAAGEAGSFLVVNSPQTSDVILVLAGETDRRPARALELLDLGFARRMVLNVPADAKIYDSTQLDLAEKYRANLPEGSKISICPIEGLSTKDESRDAAECIRRLGGVKTVLIVTSDYHTRRALSVFRKYLPQYSCSIAAAGDPAEFGVKWWEHRQWAKTVLYEWMRLVWWTLIDRWS